MGNWGSISQWLNFKLFGITYLVGKIKFKLFFSGSTGWVRGLQPYKRPYKKDWFPWSSFTLLLGGISNPIYKRLVFGPNLVRVTSTRVKDFYVFWKVASGACRMEVYGACWMLALDFDTPPTFISSRESEGLTPSTSWGMDFYAWCFLFLLFFSWMSQLM